MGDTEQYYCILHLEGSVLSRFSSSIWLEMVYILKGQWDCTVGDSDDKIARRDEVLTLWTTTPLVTSKNGTPFQHFEPPKQLFPPPNNIEFKTLQIHILLYTQYEIYSNALANIRFYTNAYVIKTYFCFFIIYFTLKKPCNKK